MAKAVYAVERSTNALKKWNGAWAQIKNAPPDGAHSLADYRLSQLFVFKGRMHLLYMKNSGAQLAVAQWDEGTLSWINQVDGPAGNHRYLSSPVLYKGNVIWFGFAGDVADQIQLYRWTGSALQETAADPNLRIGFGISVDNGNTTQTVWEQVPLVFAFRERLALFGHCIWFRASTSGMSCMDDCWVLDHTQANSGNNGTQLLGNPTVNAVTQMIASMPSVDTVRTRGFGGGVWRNKLVMVGLDGWVKEVGLTGPDQLTRLFDFRNHPALDISGNPLVSNGTPSGTLSINDSRIPTLLQRAHPIGAKFDINGTIATVWQFAASQYSLFDEATGVALADGFAPSGTPFEVLTKGMGPVTGGHVSVNNGIHMDCRVLEDGDFIWVIIGAAKTYTTQTQDEMWGLLVAKYDMVNGGAPTFLDVREFGNIKPDVGGFNAEIDPESNNLHILWFDQSTDEYKHAIINRSTHAITGPGTSSTPGVAFAGSAADNGMGVGHNIMIPFVEGEPTVEIDSVTYDEVFSSSTILYTVHNLESETVDVTVEFQDGSGAWKLCTRKGTEGEATTARSTSPAGTQHTFVHDVLADLPGFTGQIQYRIKVSE